MQDLVAALEAAIRDAPGGTLVEPGERVLVACSGGFDSTSLLFALAELNRRPGWDLDLRAVHVHHGLRGAEADRDRDFVASCARRLGVGLEERRADVGAVRAEEGGTLEEVARRVRYRFFEEVAAATGAAKVATAHHRDDQVETVLQRILRGTGVRGVAGIPLRRRIGGANGPLVVRPFLGLGRAEVRGYLAALGVAAHEDSSNLSAAHLRNRIRSEALPYLRTLAPQVDASLVKLARAASQAAEVLEGEATRRLDAAGIPPRAPLEVPLALIRETPPDLRPILLMRAVERALGAQLVSRHADALLDLALARGAGGEVHLPRGFVVRRAYDALVVEPAAPAPAAVAPPGVVEARIRIPGRTEVPGLGVAVEARSLSHGRDRIDPAAAARAPEGRTALFDLAHLPGPLALRHPRAGDAIYPVGMAGRKKLQDLFVDGKVPRADRARALVLDAGGHVAWVVGHRIDRRFVATEETREALELRVEEL